MPALDKDVLFLLPPGFIDNGRREFCPECAEMWGLLSWYPAIREAVEIRYVGIDHPRAPICALLGEGRWNAPTLVLAADPKRQSEPDAAQANGRQYFDSARQIARYYAGQYGLPVPRGSAA